MKTQELIESMEKTFNKCLETAKRKNHDYASGDTGQDALRNFKLVEHLNITDISTGILVRMCDKVSRLTTVYKVKCHVNNETVFDTIDDLINYAAILKAAIEDNNKGEKESMNETTAREIRKSKTKIPRNPQM